jgi:hypothetical protein
MNTLPLFEPESVSPPCGNDDWFTRQTSSLVPAPVLAQSTSTLAHARTSTASSRHPYFDQQTDGLAHPWHARVWLNPPYSEPEPWVNKLLDEYSNYRVSAAIALLKDANDNAYLRCLAGYACILFASPRIPFLRGRTFRGQPAIRQRDILPRAFTGALYRGLQRNRLPG